MRLALAQINSTVGDLAANSRKISECIRQARAASADLVAFPELAITGYPPEDLLLKPDFLRANQACLEEIADECRGIVAVVGCVEVAEAAYNAAALLDDGQVVAMTRKQRLPNYGVFDEARYFRPGAPGPLFELDDSHFAINICEDIWHPSGPATVQASAGAQLILNINASPYHRGKQAQRERMLATRANDNTVLVAYVNMVGGQDELVFDGASVVFDERGAMVARAKSFQEDLLLVDLELTSVFRARLRDPRWRHSEDDGLRRIRLGDAGFRARSGESRGASPESRVGSRQRAMPRRIEPALDEVEEIYRALVLGTGDYVRKNGFERVVIGLSGGIDSSLVATIAADALGADRVTGVSMPSRYSSPGSQSDAQRLAENLGIALLTVPIEPAFGAYGEMLSEAFAGTSEGLAEENIQARIRGMILMALSNKFGSLVLTTGNKSEMAVGYATLYGDMAGGFAVVKDVPKTLVYKLSRWRNAHGQRPVIPEGVLEKPPSAELRPDQKDRDSLPPYESLDPVLEAYVEQDRAADEIVALGHDPETVARVTGMVDAAEYKRRQAPPGVKITERAFGRDRRLPITNRYRQPIP